MEFIPRWKTSRWCSVVAMVGVAVAATACNTEPVAENDLTPPPVEPTGGATDDADAAAPALQVVSPADGDVVTLPFDVTVDTDVELGPIEDEVHHFHVWFDEPGEEPNVVEGSTGTVDGQVIVPPDGETTMVVQVHTFDHQPHGDPVEIALTVEGAAPGGGEGTEEGGDTGGGDTGGGDDGGGYDY